MDLIQSADPRDHPSSDGNATLSEAMHLAKERVDIAIGLQQSTLHEFVLTDDIDSAQRSATVFNPDRRQSRSEGRMCQVSIVPRPFRRSAALNSVMKICAPSSPAPPCPSSRDSLSSAAPLSK
jgi:hypothetical protein